MQVGSEYHPANSKSVCNDSEATAVVDFVKSFLAHGFSGCDIGIISPYNAQSVLIKSNLRQEALNLSGLRWTLWNVFRDPNARL